MFLDELSPVLRELVQHPVAFLGGFFAGALRLNLNDDPVKSWLNHQTGVTAPTTSSSAEAYNGKTQGPQAISIE
jgi:hypothetical protein